MTEMIRGDFSELASVGRTLEFASVEQAAAAGAWLQKKALGIEGDAKRNAPVLTGTLRRSITHEIRDTPGGATADIGTDLAYARRVEEGFVGTDSLGRVYDQPGQPYLGPALDAHEDDFVEGLAAIAANIL